MTLPLVPPQGTVVPQAIAALARAFKVRRPVVGPLKLPRDCAQLQQVVSTGEIYCAKFVETHTCSGFVPAGIPESHFGDASCAPSSVSQYRP